MRLLGGWTFMPLISCEQCRWFFAEVLPEANRLLARLERYPSHRAMLEREVAAEAGWKTLRGRGGRAKVVRETVRQMEANWSPSLPRGANVRPLRLGNLVVLLMGTQVWLNHLREQSAVRGRKQHAKENGLEHLYDAELGRALSASDGTWPARRKAGTIHVTANLLDIDEKTVQRRLTANAGNAAHESSV
jgi:hypothetical protein